MPRLVFVTGASSGIGQALAWRYYLAGYSLALVSRRTAEVKSWVMARQISADKCQIYSADVSVPDSIVAAGQACIEQQGVPDVVIANAGISQGVNTALREDLAVMTRILATNTTGVAATFQPFIAAMIGRGTGVLVGIGSVAGIRGLPGHGAYCASKAAGISFCESLRGELRTSGIQVVTLCPGYIDTPLTKNNRYMMPFLTQPDDFANKAWEAIEAGVSYRVIPWQMGLLAKLLRLMPNVLFDRVIAGRSRKPRATET
jgi:short-subunit dehydrogenase